MKQYNKIFTILTFFLLGCSQPEIIAQHCDRQSVLVENNVFKVNYSETLEQPLWVIYTSENRPKNVDRGSMNFYVDKEVCTSDNKDYYRNVWDKGHMAPAATFSDSYENLKLTFSYLNCSLQNQYLNRGEWRLLEEQEREWDDLENLTIKVIPVYTDQSERLPTKAVIPDAYHKHIKFENQGVIKCYFFLNVKPEKGWEEHDNTSDCDILEDFTF